MGTLEKKLQELIELAKAIKSTALNSYTGIKQPSSSSMPSMPSIPSIKPPSPPSMRMRQPSGSSPSKIPGIAPDSKKDPKKIAEQIKDGSMSTKTQKVMLKWDQGWSDEDVEKADREAIGYMYHIHDGPYRITSRPLSIREIEDQYGGVKRLESSGFRLIRHTDEPNKTSPGKSSSPAAPKTK